MSRSILFAIAGGHLVDSAKSQYFVFLVEDLAIPGQVSCYTGADSRLMWLFGQRACLSRSLCRIVLSVA